MKANKNPNLKNRARILLATAITLSELVLIYLSHEQTWDKIILTIAAIVVLNVSFVVFWWREKQTQNELILARNHESAERERIVAIVNSLPEAILSANSNGKIEIFNSSATDLIGVNHKLTGRNIFSTLKLTKPNGQNFDLKEVFRAGNPIYSINDLALDNNGEKLRIELDIISFLVKSDKKNAHPSRKFVAILRDITKQKTLDEERDEFISVVSHELRTPVAIAEGAVSNLKLAISKGLPHDILARNADITYEQIVFLATMVNDLSTLSHAERGVGDNFERISPQEIGQNLFAKYQKTAADKGLTLNLDLQPNLPHLTTSKLYVEELLQNIITNAIKYTKQGEVKIEISQTADSVRFLVADSGIGISKSDQKRIFEKFYRSEDYRTRETGGTGLGLYVATKLARKIGTKIELSSRLNHGSKFWFDVKNNKKGTHHNCEKSEIIHRNES